MINTCEDDIVKHIISNMMTNYLSVNKWTLLIGPGLIVFVQRPSFSCRGAMYVPLVTSLYLLCKIIFEY